MTPMEFDEASEIISAALADLAVMPVSSPVTAARMRTAVGDLIADLGDALQDGVAGARVAAIFRVAGGSGIPFEAWEDMITELVAVDPITEGGKAALRLVTGGAAIEAAVAADRMTFRTRTDADRFILRIGALMDTALDAVEDAEDGEVSPAIARLYSAAVRSLQERARPLPRIVSTETRNLPSLVLADELYRDPPRSDEIEVANDVVHPAFLPDLVEVLSA